jgi:MFS family permease
MSRRIEGEKRSLYGIYMLILLATIAAFNNADTSAIGLVLQNIKTTFKVTDTELGFMTGIAFTLFYSTLGVPIGRWADRGNRVAIIGLSIGLRSLMLMLTGATRSFGQLLSVRVGVAIGEAGCFPPAFSLIADEFTQAERPQAVGKFFAGGAMSAVLGYFLGGWLNQLYGWRTMFLLLGLPGPLLMILAWLTLREPRLRGGNSGIEAAPEAPRVSASQVSRALWANRTFRHLLAAICVTSFFGSGASQWQPAFFIRSFGFDTERLGIWFSLMFGIGGGAAMYLGGALASRYAPKNERMQLKSMAALYVAFCVLSVCAYLSASPITSLVLTGLATAGVLLQGGPLYAAIQTVVPTTMLATTISVVFLVSNLVGTGLGPLAVGALSDSLRHVFGEESLRYALLATCPGFLWGAWHLAQAARTVKADTEAAAQSPGSSGPECSQGRILIG